MCVVQVTGINYYASVISVYSLKMIDGIQVGVSSRSIPTGTIIFNQALINVLN